AGADVAELADELDRGADGHHDGERRRDALVDRDDQIAAQRRHALASGGEGVNQPAARPSSQSATSAAAPCTHHNPIHSGTSSRSTQTRAIESTFTYVI